jgi:hypothetical protein
MSIVIVGIRSQISNPESSDLDTPYPKYPKLCNDLNTFDFCYAWQLQSINPKPYIGKP